MFFITPYPFQILVYLYNSFSYYCSFFICCFRHMYFSTANLIQYYTNFNAMKNGPVNMNKNIFVFLWLPKILSAALCRSRFYSFMGFSLRNSSAISAFSSISKGSLLILEPSFSYFLDEESSVRSSGVRS